METKMDYKDAVKLLISQVKTVGEEQVKLEKAYGRVLAHKLQADENVPAFDRSPYDGYAFRAKDSKGASKECPVTLRITEEIPAGSAPRLKVTEGTAAKILTGAPVPEGADCVIMYEKTAFTKDTVTIFDEMSAGDNIIYAGEDIRKGELLAQAGQIIDAGLAGSLAAQKKAFPLVYRRPVAGIISSFETQEQQEAAAAMFNAHMPGLDSAADREKTLRELVYSIREASLARKTRADGAGAPVLTMQELLQEKQQLQALRTARFIV